MYYSTYCDAAYVPQEPITMHPNVANTFISGTSDFSNIILFYTYHINALLLCIIEQQRTYLWRLKSDESMNPTI